MYACQVHHSTDILHMDTHIVTMIWYITVSSRAPYYICTREPHEPKVCWHRFWMGWMAGGGPQDTAQHVKLIATQCFCCICCWSNRPFKPPWKQIRSARSLVTGRRGVTDMRFNSINEGGEEEIGTPAFPTATLGNISIASLSKLRPAGDRPPSNQ